MMNFFRENLPKTLDKFRLPVLMGILIFVFPFSLIAGQFDDPHWELFTYRSEVLSLDFSDNGDFLWVGTAGGLEKRDPNTGQVLRVYTILDGLWANRVEAVISDGSGGLWAGTASGLCRIMADGDLQKIATKNYGPSYTSFKALALDGNGGLWVGSYNRGLGHLFPDGSWRVYTTDNSQIPGNQVECLLPDGEGGLWVGTSYDGLGRLLADGTWTNYPSPGACGGQVQSLAYDSSGALWVGTDWGVGILQPNGAWQALLHVNGDASDPLINALCLMPDGAGGMWIGTPDGLARYLADGSWQVLDADNSDLPDNRVNSLAKDNTGGLWAGTRRGLAHLSSNGAWQVFSSLSNIGGHLVSLAPDESGSLWVGIPESGLHHLKPDGSCQVLNTRNSGLPDIGITDLEPDGTGGLWVGTEKRAGPHVCRRFLAGLSNGKFGPAGQPCPFPFNR